MGLAEKYCEDIREQMEYYATWLPNVVMRLGDYGTVDDDVFTKQGNIREFGIQFQAELGVAQGEPQEYVSEGTSVTDIAAGVGGLVNAGLKFSFTKKHGVCFKAANCELSLMLEQATVFQKLSQEFRARDMEDYFIVTQVLKAGAFTLVTSKSSNAELVIEAKNNQLPSIDLTIPNFSYNTKKASNVGYSFIAKSELTPLIQLREVDID